MKISYIKMLILLLVFSLLALLNFFVFNIKSLYILSFIILIGVIFSKWLFGYEKDNYRGRKDVMFNIFICSFIYLIITYILGIFTGFVKNAYLIELLPIIKNITPFLIFITLSEILRYILVTKGKGNKLIIVLIVIFFVILDINFNVSINLLDSGDAFVEIFLTCLFGSISKNMLLTYLTYKVGYKPCILYLLIFESTMYFLPIFPDFGIYIGALLDVIFPAFLLFVNYSFLNKNKQINYNSGYYKYRDLISIVCVIIFCFFIMIALLCSGLFRYYVVTIGSGSMNPYISKGDVVLIDQKADFNNLKKKDVLAFNHDGKIIVHRIIAKVQDKEVLYYTKGDNNNFSDGFPITTKEIVGKGGLRIKYIGYPTVMLNELIRR